MHRNHLPKRSKERRRALPANMSARMAGLEIWLGGVESNKKVLNRLEGAEDAVLRTYALRVRKMRDVHAQTERGAMQYVKRVRAVCEWDVDGELTVQPWRGLPMTDEVAEYVLSSPLHFPYWLVTEAELRMRSRTSVSAVGSVAERDEWTFE